MFMDGMSLPTPSIELPTQRSEAVERRARHLRILAKLADVGMELVEHVKRQVLEEEVSPGRAKCADPVLSYARLARAVRQTLALEAKVVADGFACAPSVAWGVAGSEGGFRSWDGKLKARVRLKVEEAIASGAEAGETEDLLRDLNERLDDPEYGDDMSDRPIGMAVALICGALGVQVDLRHFSDAELGFDREDMKAAARAAKQAALDVAAVSDGSETELPVWRPKVGTGVDPP